MKNLWYCDLSVGKYDLINQISLGTTFQDCVWSLKQDLHIPFVICKHLTSVWTSLGNRPSNRACERTTQAPEVYWWEKRIHLHISACLSPPSEGCTQKWLYLNQEGSVHGEDFDSVDTQMLCRAGPFSRRARRACLREHGHFVCHSELFKSKIIFFHIIFGLLSFTSEIF